MSLRFQETCRRHARAFWPSQCEELGEEGLVARVQLAISRAGKFGIETEREVARFLDLMFVWGDDFPELKRTAWAKDVLEDDTLDAPLKVHQLSYRTKRELDRK